MNVMWFTTALSERQKRLYNFLCSGFRSFKQISEYMECSKNSADGQLRRLGKYFPLKMCAKDKHQNTQTIFWIDPSLFKRKYYKPGVGEEHIWLDRCEICKSDEHPNAGKGICLDCRKNRKHYQKPLIIKKSGARLPTIARTVKTENLDNESWGKVFRNQMDKSIKKCERENKILENAALSGDTDAMVKLKLKRHNGHSVELPKEPWSPRKRLAEMGLRVYG